MKKRIEVVIEKGERNYSAFIPSVDGIIATGSSLEEIRSNMVGAIGEFVEACKDFGYDIPEELVGEYDLDFRMDVQSFLDIYSGIFSKSGLEKLTGINQKQLWHYAKGSSKPRRPQVQRIEKALHSLGTELISLHL